MLGSFVPIGLSLPLPFKPLRSQGETPGPASQQCPRRALDRIKSDPPVLDWPLMLKRTPARINHPGMVRYKTLYKSWGISTNNLHWWVDPGFLNHQQSVISWIRCIPPIGWYPQTCFAGWTKTSRRTVFRACRCRTLFKKHLLWTTEKRGNFHGFVTLQFEKTL